MVKMTAPENMGSVNVNGQSYAPAADGCLYVPDDLDGEVLDVLRSHGYKLVGYVSDVLKRGKAAAQPEQPVA